MQDIQFESIWIFKLSSFYLVEIIDEIYLNEIWYSNCLTLDYFLTFKNKYKSRFRAVWVREVWNEKHDSNNFLYEDTNNGST